MMSKEDTCIDFMLHKSNVFFALNENEKEILIDGCLFYTYKKNERLFKEGFKPSGLLYLHKGAIKAFKSNKNSVQFITRLIALDSLICYDSFISGSNYFESAESMELSSVVSIDRNTVFKLLRSNAVFSISVMSRMIEESSFVTERALNMGQKSVLSRAADSLLLLKNIYGYRKESNIINISLKRQDFANLSNMTTANGIKALASFAKEKIISLSGRDITINDFDNLFDISEHETFY